MLQQIKSKNLFLLTSLWLLLVLSIFSLFSGLFSRSSDHRVEAASSSTINFQARLLTSTGALVPDGYYNAQFKLYSVSSGGSAEWTETYYDSNGVTAGNDNRVRVVNGYLSVYLGSQTSFPGTINWDQQQWVTLNIGGTTQTATPTWDGEMNPRLQLTAVPYAFRAAQLAKLTGSNTSTLDFATQTGARSILLPDESGTLCIQNSSNCGFASASGSSNYIQNGTSVQTGANFNIDGSGVIGTSLTTPQVTSTGALTLQSSGANAISLDSGTTGEVNIGTGANAKAITIGNNAVSGTTISIGAGTTSGSTTGALNLLAAAGGSINIGTNSVANKVIYIGSSGSLGQATSIHIGDTTGNSAQVLTLGSTTNGSSTTTVQGGTGANAVSIQSGASGTISIGSSGVANTVQIGNTSGAVTQTINIGNNATASSTSNITVGSTKGGTTTIQGATVKQTVTGGSVTVQSVTTNNSAAFQVQNTSGSNLFVADTTNSRVGINTGSLSLNTNLNVYNGGESTTQTDLTQNMTNSGINVITDYVQDAYTAGLFWSTQNNNPTAPKAGIYTQLTDNGSKLLFGTSSSYTAGLTNTALTLGYNGEAVFRNGTNTSKGFQVQNATGTGLFTIDTTTGAALTSSLYVDTLGSGGTTALCRNSSLQISTCSGGGSVSLQSAYDGGSSITIPNGGDPVTINASGSGGGGILLTAPSAGDNTPFIDWSNGATDFGIRSDDDALHLGSWDSPTGSTFYNSLNLYTDGSLVLQNNAGDDILSADGTSMEVVIGSSSAAGTLAIQGSLGTISTSDTGNNLNFSRDGSNYIEATDTSGDLRFGAGGNSNNIVLNTDGTVQFQNFDESTTAFQIQDSGGNNLFNVNTTNGTVSIGGPTTVATFKVTSSTSGQVGLIVNKTAGTDDLLRLQNNGSSVFVVDTDGNLTLENPDNTLHQVLIENNASGGAFRFGDNANGSLSNGLQGGYGKETQLYSYYGLVLQGYREATAPALFTQGTHDADVTVLGSTNSDSILQIQNSSGDSALDLFYDGGRDSGVLKLGGGVSGGYLEFDNNNSFKWSIGMDSYHGCDASTPNDTLYFYTNAGGCALQLAYGGEATFFSSSSSEAFRVLDEDSNTVLQVDTTSDQINFFGGAHEVATFDYQDGSDSGAMSYVSFQNNRAEVGYDGNWPAAYLMGSTDKGLYLAVDGNNVNPALYIDPDGAAAFRPGTDSSSAFQIQDASGTSLFTADTTNSQLLVDNTTTLKIQNIDSSGSYSTITRTNRVAASSATNFGTGNYTPAGTFTPGASHVLLAYVNYESNNASMPSDASNITISGGSLTWVPITGSFDRSAGWGVGFRVFYAVTSSAPSSMQVTVGSGGSSISKYEVTVDDMDGVDTTNPVVGSVSANRQSSSNNTWTATLGATPATADWEIITGSFDQDNATHSWSAATGWTENSAPASLRPSPDSTVMYQTGTNSTTLNFKAGTLQYSPNVDTAYGGFILKAGGGSTINLGLGTATSINIGNSASQLTVSGTTLFKNTTSNSTTALQVQNTAGSAILDVDTQNGRVGVGAGNNAPTRTLDSNGTLGGGGDVESFTDSSATTHTVSTGATAYYVSTSSGTTNSTFNSTVNITGLPSTDGTFAFFTVVATKGNSSGSQSHSTILQVGGTTFSTVTTATGTGSSTRTHSFTLARINGTWRVVGSGLGSAVAATSDTATTADFAEWIHYSGETQPQPGDVLTIGDDPVSAKSSDSPYDTRILGVVSTSPYEVGSQDDGHSVILALTGRVPVNVSLENGPIQAGDPLTSSSVAGVAMKATRPGKIIGYALQNYDGTQLDPQIMVQLQVGYNNPYNNAVSQLQGGQSIDGDLFVHGAIEVDNITVTGTANVNGLVVSGDSTLQNSLTVSGDSTLQGNLTVAGDSALGGNLIAGQNLTVSGNTGLSNNLSVTGATTLSGNLTVTGSSHLQQITASSVDITGAVSAGSLMANTADITQIYAANASITNLSVSGMATIGTLHITGSSIFDGDITLNAHLITGVIDGNSQLTTEVTSAAGTDINGNKDAVCVIDGNDTSGTITLTTGSLNTSDGAMCKATFAKPFSFAPRSIIGSTDKDSTQIGAYVTADTDSFTLNLINAPQAGHTYKFNYWNPQ